MAGLAEVSLCSTILDPNETMAARSVEDTINSTVDWGSWHHYCVMYNNATDKSYESAYNATGVALYFDGQVAVSWGATLNTGSLYPMRLGGDEASTLAVGVAADDEEPRVSAEVDVDVDHVKVAVLLVLVVLDEPLG